MPSKTTKNLGGFGFKPINFRSILHIQATYVLFRDDDALKLPYCIAVSGFVCALFAFGIPYLSALRIWLGFSTVFGLIYVIAAFVLSLKDGMYCINASCLIY